MKGMLSYSLFLIVSLLLVVVAFAIGWLLGRMRTQSQLQQAYKEMGQQSQINEQHLRHLFEGISAQSLQNTSNAYLHQSNSHLRNIIEPLQRDLHKLDTQIQQLEHRRTDAYRGISSTVAQLNEEIKSLHQSNRNLEGTTQKLNQALRSDYSTRGKWGEIQLRRIAEITGMVNHIDFQEQVHINKEESHIRPDMIIHLPHNGFIPVDAKAPMSAYLDALDAESEEQRMYLLDAHKKAIQQHVRSLAKKEYWARNQHGVPPQLVVMFLPYESGYEASISYDPALLDEALSKKVIIAGPSTLYALLKVIAYGWMQLTLTQNTEKIYETCTKLFSRFSVFYKHFDSVGQSLTKAVHTYNQASGSLRQNFIPLLEKINTHSATQHTLPSDEEATEIEEVQTTKSNHVSTQTHHNSPKAYSRHYE